VRLKGDLSRSEHFDSCRAMVTVLGEHHPGHRPNNLCAAGSRNWIIDCDFNVDSDWWNCHRAERDFGNFNQSNYAFGQSNGLFHQSTSEQQQRLARKRWLGVESRGFEKFMNVSSVLDQSVAIRNCEQSFGRVQHYWHTRESIGAESISKEMKVRA
jgi:hypothetical protein